MTTLTAPPRNASRRSRSTTLLVSAGVVSVLTLTAAATLPRLMSTSVVPAPSTSVSWAPGGGGNESHPTIPRHPVVRVHGRN
jgi:hypothetical protein